MAEPMDYKPPKKRKSLLDHIKDAGKPPDNLTHLFKLPSLEIPQEQNSNSGDNSFRTHEHIDTKAHEHKDTKTHEHLPEHLPEHKDTKAHEHKDTTAQGHKDTRTPEHIDTKAQEHIDTLKSEHINTKTHEHINTKTHEHMHTKTHERMDTSNRSENLLFDISLKPKDLMPVQFRILHEIYFKRPFKVRGPNRIGVYDNFQIPYATVRNSLRSLERKGYISNISAIYYGTEKATTCQVNESKCVPLFGKSLIINSEQIKKSNYLDYLKTGHMSTWTPEHIDTKAHGHIDTLKSECINTRAHEHMDTKTPGRMDTWTPEHSNIAYKTDRMILKNLSVYVETSEYWKGQGLTLKKCEQWIQEMPHCNPEFLLIQLQFGEHTEKVFKSDKPVSYFRSCLMSGGLERPKGFEFPEEKAARIKQFEFEALQKALSEQENFRKIEKELTDKKNFLDMLKDKETVDYLINQIESKFITQTTKFSIKAYRTNGEIDSKLEIALQREFFMSESK